MIIKGMVVTEKRVVAVFTAFCIAVGAICFRLFDICINGSKFTSSSGGHYFTLEVGMVRGDILDCNRNPIINSGYENYVVLKPTTKALNAINDIVDADTFSHIKSRMEKGNAVSLNIGTSEITPNSDAILIKNKIRYSKPFYARHITGYLNEEGHGVTGLEKSFDNLLYTGESISVRLPTDVYGRIISGAEAEIGNAGIKTGSVVLTVDMRFQQIAEDAIDSCCVEQGSVVIADGESGAIKAMVSRPNYNPENISDALDEEGSPLVNRNLYAYSVGSVFKVVVAAASIENGLENFEYTCNGSCVVDGVSFGCNNHKAHGRMNMQKALECSCNTYFINLAQKLGMDKMYEYAQLSGFGQSIDIASGMTASPGVIPEKSSLLKSGNLANFSFGQGDFTATPMHLVQIFSAVANGGKYYQPYLVESTETADGKTSTHKSRYPVIAFSEETADKLTKMLTSVVERGNGSKAKPDNVTAAGKTATAQTGTFKNGVEICNTWFCGFFYAQEKKYIVVILKQGGYSGATDCAPVFKIIADKISKLQ